MQGETREIVYRHPKGYYAIVERRGKGRLGGEYRIREAVYPRLTQRKPASEPEPIQTIKIVCVTEQDKTRFAKLYRQGYTTAKIAEICGWSKATVFRYLKQMGAIRERKKLTDCDKTRIENLAQNGATGAQIAVVVGFDATTVNKYLRSIGMRKDKTQPTAGKEAKK